MRNASWFLASGLVLALWPGLAKPDIAPQLEIQGLVRQGQDVQVAIGLDTSGDPPATPYALYREVGDSAILLADFVPETSKAEVRVHSGDCDLMACHLNDPSDCKDHPEQCSDCDQDGTPECCGTCETSYVYTWNVPDPCVPAGEATYDLFDEESQYYVDRKTLDVGAWGTNPFTHGVSTRDCSDKTSALHLVSLPAERNGSDQNSDSSGCSVANAGSSGFGVFSLLLAIGLAALLAGRKRGKR